MAQLHPLRITLVYGGVSLNPQTRELQKSEVVVATPGRLLDHLNRGNVKLDKIDFLVLDEADRMLDMGFIIDVEKIIRRCVQKRQTLFFSATMPTRIKELAKKYMKNPLNISAKKFVDHSKLKQVYYNVQRDIKSSLLSYLLEKEESELAMVFCNTRRTVDYVVRRLRSADVNAIGIHGGLSQYARDKTLTSFKKSKRGVLICTDVAARGLDINYVSHIYNYDLPQDPTDYVHRIGRTARAGEKGKVINLLCERDHENFRKILKDYSQFKIQKEDTPYVKKIKVEHRSEGDGGNTRRKAYSKSRRNSDSKYSSKRSTGSKYSSRSSSSSTSYSRNSSDSKYPHKKSSSAKYSSRNSSGDTSSSKNSADSKYPHKKSSSSNYQKRRFEHKK